mmetsp:Transcript_40773/g.127587  ORF Transcript_40773/g.127587 Transcript_40773/m.127587 type:complete len:229 (-) Transcript_40773:497-1183(-)
MLSPHVETHSIFHHTSWPAEEPSEQKDAMSRRRRPTVMTGRLVRHLVVVAGGLALGIEDAGPVPALELSAGVLVNLHLDVGARRAHREGGDVLGRLELAEHHRAEDGRERAPVTHDLTGLEGEGGLVKRADDHTVGHGALVKRSAEVRAHVSEAVDGTVGVGGNEEVHAVGLHRHELALADVGGLEHGHPLHLGASAGHHVEGAGGAGRAGRGRAGLSHCREEEGGLG